MIASMRSCLLTMSLLSGCCVVPPIPSLPPPPVAPMPATAPAMGPATTGPAIDPSMGMPPSLVGPELETTFEIDASRVPQLDGLRRLYDGASPVEGALENTVLVCNATLLGGGFDDSFFAGGADVALALRLGTGALRSTPQSSERMYSFPVRRLAAGETVWVRVLDRDVVFDDTIAEGSASYSRTPLLLTMGQADVACRALAPGLVAERSAEAVAALERAVEDLAAPSTMIQPDVAAPNLGYPLGAVERVRAALSRAAAWMDPSAPELESALGPARAWSERWAQARRDAVDRAMRELPPPGAEVVDGARRIAVREVLCGASAQAIRSEVASSLDPGGCVVVVHVEGEGHVHDPTLRPVTSWALDRTATPISLAPYGIRRDEDGAWQQLEGSVSFATAGDIAFVLPPGVDATLLRLGAPLAPGLALRLQ